MLKLLALLVMCIAPMWAQGQTPPSNEYQPGTITAVSRHPSQVGQGGSDTVKYDVSVKVRNVIYTVLYAPPAGANTVEYSAGIELLVLVGSDTLTFNTAAAGKNVVPILRRQTLSAEPTLEASKLPGQYFTMKQQHLAETLDLTDDQQAKIKPILEQEAGEANAFLGNPVISRSDQLNRWEKLVRASDEKIKPYLSQVQQGKLQDLRKEQKEQLKQMIAEGKANKSN